jgi:DNA segregation ATPase FtsK/SpoIIIE, S-DNA-T family
MTTKILRYQLFILFGLALINIVHYYMASEQPDNYFVISSVNDSISVLNYYIYSFVAFISYYVGPWVVLPFLVYSFFYTFLISKRTRSSDAVVGLVLCLFFYGLIFLMYPGLIGKGLLYFSSGIFTTYTAFFTTLFFGIIIFALTLRGTFIMTVKRFQITLERIGLVLWKNVGRFYVYLKDSLPRKKPIISKVDLQKKAISFVKDGIDKVQTISKKEKTDNEPNSTDNSTGPIVLVNKEAEPKQPILHKESSSQIIPSNTKDYLQTPSSKIKNLSTNVYDSSELISCIKVNPNMTKPKGPDNDYFENIKESIEQKLNEFKIDCRITNVLKGPVVDTFELELGEGVKLAKVLSLSDDLGLALNGVPVRMVYPMRGRSTIGIEVPRNPREYILLDEVLRSPEFTNTQHRLPVAMGKDAFGEVKVTDLAGMPHMLVAGATGAGKSVFINTMLVSLITKRTPRELKLVLIDPKQLELALYERLPHLMLPVIVDSKSASIALLWLVQEMERRYSILKELGVKNIDGFNKKLTTCDESLILNINKFYEDARDEGYELPYIVCVIDEFADLILSKAGKDIEMNVNRLAAKARAAGIHMVVATQRPSTDVITGVIKANFPTRIAFTVTSGHDSKTILDKYGAEKLLKRGDMLYKHSVELTRMHSAFVEEDEIEGLIEKLAEIPANFNQQALNFLETGGEEENQASDVKVSFVSGTTDDPLYNDALEVVIQKGQASASLLQRALRVGYNRAANIIDEMEKNGVIGPAEGSKPRRVIGRGE